MLPVFGNGHTTDWVWVNDVVRELAPLTSCTESPWLLASRLPSVRVGSVTTLRGVSLFAAKARVLPAVKTASAQVAELAY